jgi:DNA-binding NarL/FixJ family response regulator
MLCGPGTDPAGVAHEREQEVAEAIGRGWGNAEIARRLYLGLPTVKVHVSRLLTKLDVANRTQVALLVHDARRPDHD